jgi:RHS repeat-associated protein
VYGPGGNKLALMSGQTLAKGFVPLSGGATAVYNSSGLAYYRHADWLGSSRFASLPSGTTRLYYDGAYAPYGENYAEVGTIDRNFTGQNQDTISSGPYPLYDFLAREYHPTWGRWLNPDPAGLAAVDPSNPQSWNRYAYVTNNPLALTDPTGLDDCQPNDGACQAAAAQMAAAKYSYMADLALAGYMNLRLEFGVLALSTTPPPGWLPVSAGAQPDCPGCYYAPSGPFQDQIWDPSQQQMLVLSDSQSSSWWASLVNYFKKTPFTVSATEGLSSQITYIPGTKTLCGAIGFGVTWPLTKAIGFGAYIHGNLNNAVPVLQGSSSSASVQLTPTIGYQATWNESGVLGGPSISGPGVRVSQTWGACGPAPW